MLKLDNITKIYRNENRKILNQVSLEANRGELIAIVGKSGSGKTTLLSIIAGLEKPTEGTVIFDQEQITSFSDDRYALFRNEKIGIVFQEFNLIDDLNVLDNITLPLSLHSSDTPSTKKQGMQLLKKFRMEHIYKRLAKNLSGGEKAKVSIARAMIQSPDIILCDEPTGSLDGENAAMVFQTLKQISKEKIVIVVTHDDAMIEDYATRLIRLHDGNIVSDETRTPDSKKDGTRILKLQTKKENPKATSKLIATHLMNRKNKATLSIASLALSFSLLIISTMFLFGFKYNINQSIKEISNPLEYVGHKITNTEITNTDISLIKQQSNIKDAFIRNNSTILTTVNSVTYGTTLETVAIEESDFNLGNQLVGSYPNMPNQAVISRNFAQLIIGQNLSSFELLNSLESVTLHAAFSEYSTLILTIVGIVDIEMFEENYVVYYRYDNYQSWIDTQTPGSVVINDAQLVVIFDSSKQVNKTIDQIYENTQIRLEKSTAALERQIQEEYQFLSTILLATTLISIVLAVATIYVLIKNSMKIQSKHVAILYALGAQKSIIRKMFIYEVQLIGVISFVIAVILSSMIGVILDLGFSSQLITMLSMYQNIVIEPIRILNSGWYIYILFFIISMSIIFVGCNFLLSRSNFHQISENLKKD